MYRGLCRFSGPLRMAIARQPSRQCVREYLWQPHWWNRPIGGSLSRSVDYLNEMEKDMDKMFRDGPSGFFNRAKRDFWRLVDDDSPTAVEFWRMRNPIVEKDGKKFMKLEFDVRRFKPEEVTVKTVGKKLEISAKHESTADECANKYEFSRQFALPEGVKAEEITCKYTEDGTLLLEAPYTAPPEAARPKETEIPVKHE